MLLGAQFHKLAGLSVANKTFEMCNLLVFYTLKSNVTVNIWTQTVKCNSNNTM